MQRVLYSQGSLRSIMIPDTTQTAATPAVELARVSRLFGGFVALRDVSLTLPAGSSVVLLGENGAGKSTLLKLIAGLAAPTYGSVTVLGDKPRDQRGRIAYMSHSTMLYDELTGMENLVYFAGLHASAAHGSLESRAADALRQVALDPTNTRRLGEYSQGMRQRASLARVLMTEPELLLLDEPFSNLDIGSARSMIDRLLAWLAEPLNSSPAELGATGKTRTLLLTTHQAELARPLARTTLTLSEGRLISRLEATA
jgi:ABC-type multidrug transport system ATPase subunit